MGRWAAGSLGRWAAGSLGRWAAGPLGRMRSRARGSTRRSLCVTPRRAAPDRRLSIRQTKRRMPIADARRLALGRRRAVWRRCVREGCRARAGRQSEGGRLV
ncbi:hypothetical protein A8H34_02975 [Burkholderia thailandensis]|nr:hypothetical protein A8H34_02975 [Burkholderia thailandensis]